MCGQTYEDRTCEIIFAGLDEATDAEKIHLFAVNAKLIVYEIETMLAGIKLVMKRSLGEILDFNTYDLFIF